MDSTTNHGLSLPSYSDWADVEVLDENFSLIDNGLLPFIDSENTTTKNLYKINTGLNKTLLKNGFGFRTVIHEDSTGNCYFKIDDINVNIPILDQKGNPFKKLKNNGVYAFTYYNGNFILISGGGCSDLDLVTAVEEDVLEGKTYIGSDEEIHTGTAPAIQGKTWIPTTSDQTIKKGGHLVGDQIIKGDENLKPENIVAPKEIFGVKGTATVKTLGGYLLSEKNSIVSYDENRERVEVDSSTVAVFCKLYAINSSGGISDEVGIILGEIVGITNFAFERYGGGDAWGYIGLKTEGTKTYLSCTNGDAHGLKVEYQVLY